MAKISIVGVGPGSPDYVTPKAKETVQTAQVVIGAERSLTLFKNDIKGAVIQLTAKNVNEALNNAIEQAEAGKTVVLLSTGDPCFSGLLKTFLNSTAGKKVEVNVVPGISSIQLCAARLNMYWDEARLFSFHEGATPEKKNQLLEAVRANSDVILLPDPKGFALYDIACYLISQGISKDTHVTVCENLSLNDERIVASDLEKIMDLKFTGLCVMVIRGSHKKKA